MEEVQEREKAYRLLASNPEVRHVMRRAIEVEEQGKADSEYYLGWEWHDIPVQPHKLRVLIEEGLVRVSYNSRSTRAHMVRDPEPVREALDAIGETDDVVVDGDIPADLFDGILGHDEVKHWIGKSLAAPLPVHVLLAGPPATAKSLFLEALAGLPGAYYALGGSSSKAGIADFLLQFRPRYLVIDELDKMSGEDFSVLLSLMSSGVVARLKRNLREVERMTVTVFTGCNRKDRLPPELLSRFVAFDFLPYSRQEFVDVAVAIITGQLGKEPDLARYIAERIADRTLDVRQAVQVAKLVDSEDEVDRFEHGTSARLF